MKAKLSWSESFKWSAIAILVYIALAVLLNLALPGIITDIGFHSGMVFAVSLAVYRFDLFRMLP